MIAADKKVIGIAYILHNKEGELLDQSGTDNPLELLLGSGSIIPGLEKELIGMSVGDKKVVNVEAANAYGEDNPELRLIVNKTDFPPDFEAELEPGFEFMMADNNGQKRVFVVIEIEGNDVKVDGNHPLAGESLKFDIEVTSLREPTADELTHGHVHSGSCSH